jgi:hypothetical protein
MMLGTGGAIVAETECIHTDEVAARFMRNTSLKIGDKSESDIRIISELVRQAHARELLFATIRASPLLCRVGLII